MKAEQLRKSILQLAIQGKLVPQDPNDEPASVLLERIHAEKQRLIKEGKIKKDKNDSVIFKGDDNRYYEKVGSEVKDITDEIDFDLPNGWVLARIGSLFYIQTGASFKKEQATNDKTKIRILRGGNIIQNGYSFFDNDIFIDYSLVSSNILLRQNDIITPAVTSIENIGKLALIERDYDNVSAGGFVFICRPYLKMSALAKFLLFALQSHYLNLRMKSITKKSGQAFYNLGKERLVQLFVPIPPIAEQARIVEAIEKFEPLIAEYDKLEQQATKLDDEIYDKLKKSILQYAIQGKLVPQDPSNEPASVLLERIRAEKKAKLGKKYVDSYIYKGDDNCYYEHIGDKVINITEEIPFDLPTWWEWARLNDLCFEISDIDHKMPKAVERGVLFLSAKDLLNDGTINYTHNVKYISEEDYNKLSTKSKPQKGDIIYSRIGACLGKARIVKKDIKFLVSYSCCTIKPLLINTEYLRCILDDVFVLNQAKKKTQSIGVPDLGIAEIKKFRIPIPPLSEQKRIVAKINEIFAML